MLQSKGLRTADDLLNYAPFRYEDRSNLKPIAQLAPGETATVVASVHSAKLAGFRRKNLGLFEAEFRDGSGGALVAKWFHGQHLVTRIVEGQKIALFGKIELDAYRGSLTMLHPEIEILADHDEEGDSTLHVGRIVPIYEGVGKVNTRALRMLIFNLLQALRPVEDRFPESVRSILNLPDRWTAFRELHFPAPNSDLRQLNAFRSPAQVRLILEEFFWLECGLWLKRKQAGAIPGISFALTPSVRDQIKAMLPFKPTLAQKRVLGEIAQDMAAAAPMNRLLQGDVGSGKTIVAAEAAVIAIENGFQVAFLAPTEILATQHYLCLRPLFSKLNYVTAALTGSFTAREKTQVKKLIASGLAHVAVGTHALLEEDVEFMKLGLVVIDEQHRFGVLQRLRLVQKGLHPDVLVMTATPIPRTLAMTVYGDLDVSTIDELPPGRRPIVTKHVDEDAIEKVWSFLRKQVSAGRQVYVVYPVVEESETAAMKAAQQMHAHLKERVFPELQVGLLHGRLTAAEKEAAMSEFKAGRLEILVATTVIEVGVDVPNATVMVIEQAERFGLAQLHQLRGRVGRGGEQSYCLLVTSKMNDAARERIRALVDSNDGFAIAELDLKLRGPGEFFGTKQSGLPSLKIANIIRDSELLAWARREARTFVERPSDGDALRRAVAYIRDHWQRKYGLVTVG